LANCILQVFIIPVVLDLAMSLRKVNIKEQTTVQNKEIESDKLEINDVEEFSAHSNSSKMEITLNIPSSTVIAQEVLRILKPQGRFNLRGVAVFVKALDSDFDLIDKFSPILSKLPTIEDCLNSLLFEGFIKPKADFINIATEDGIENIFETIGRNNAKNKEDVIKSLLSKLAFADISAYKPDYEAGTSMTILRRKIQN